MLILSALLRLLYQILRLGVRVAGSVEVGRPYRKWSKTKPASEDWENLPFHFDDIDRYAPSPKRGPVQNAKFEQPIDTATGLPSGNPVARPRRPE